MHRKHRLLQPEWTIRDLNPGPSGYEPDALTNRANGPNSTLECAYVEFSEDKFKWEPSDDKLLSGTAIQMGSV